MYAILDIETTGGKYNKEGITEIAIYQHDGSKVTDQLITLINPERQIQPFVEKLTGINNNMLKSAPRFFEVAKRIIEITDKCILVAHNADFDYRILKTEFNRLGYKFERKSICTVNLSKKLLPNIESYKLGNLAQSLGIPISQRHRANGDAMATVKLFELLLEKDSNKEILKSYIKILNGQNVPSKYLKIVEDLPNETGVYYIHNIIGDIIYIGKSNNIQKRVRGHLSGKSRKALKIQKKILKVNFEKTGSELIALLKEQNEIKKNKPTINKDGRYRIYPYGIRIDRSTKYYQLILEQVRNNQKYLVVFKNARLAENVLISWIKDNQFCQNQSSIQDNDGTCLEFKKDNCKGACLELESSDDYNNRIKKLIPQNDYPYNNFLIIDRGRKHGEYSFIFIQNRALIGYGFFELNHQIKTQKKIINRLIHIEENSDCRALIISFLKRKKYRKLIPLD